MRSGRVGDILAALPPELSGLVARLRDAAMARGIGLYLVGGPVRDWLLERPLRDVDLVVDPGGEAEAFVREAVPRGVRVAAHERFGTLKLTLDAHQVDVTSARRESYARPGALPRVEPGTLEDDLHRRDFTVNSLAIALDDDGAPARVVDFEEGLRDLEERQLRIIHARSFHDDPTRALRAARLGPRLGFNLTRGSRNALRDAIRDGAFGGVSGDRIRREFERLFSDVDLGLAPVDALRRLADWHVLPALEPGLGLPPQSVAPLRRLGRALADPPWRATRLRPLVAGLATWLAPLGPSLRNRTLERLAVRGETASRIGSFPRDSATWGRALARSRGRGAFDAVLSEIDEDRLLALYVASAPAIRRRIVRWATQDRGRRLPVNGSDLSALGIEGPDVGRSLARIRAAYLDGALANREEALALARELAAARKGSTRRGSRS